MAKQKKVTINHYLNKRLKPRVFDGKEYYTPYTRVTFDRNNTIFSMDWYRNMEQAPSDPFYNRFTIEEFQNFLKDEEGFVLEINNMIKQSIRYEFYFFGQDFELKGFGDRLEVYRTTLYELFYEEIQKEVINGLEPHLSPPEIIKVRRALNDPIFSLNGIEIGDKDLSYFKQYLPNSIFRDINFCQLLAAYRVPTLGNTPPRPLTVFDWVIRDMKSDFENFISSFMGDKKQKLASLDLERIDMYANKALAKVY